MKELNLGFYTTGRSLEDRISGFYEVFSTTDNRESREKREETTGRDSPNISIPKNISDKENYSFLLALEKCSKISEEIC